MSDNKITQAHVYAGSCLIVSTRILMSFAHDYVHQFQILNCGWLMDHMALTWVVWKSSTMVPGVLFVTVDGTTLMAGLLAGL